MNKIPVFDIGDTLLPSHEKINEKVREELERKGVEEVPELPINEYNIYKPSEIEEWLEENGIEADARDLKQAYKDWEKSFLEENILGELRKISQRFGPIGFISDNSIAAKEFYEKVFDEAEIDYQGFVVSEEVGAEKPDRKIFRAFLKRRNENADRFVYFGNYVDRDKGAEKAGMHFVWDDQFYVFNTSFNGPRIHSLTYENVKKALKQVENE